MPELGNSYYDQFFDERPTSEQKEGSIVIMKQSGCTPSPTNCKNCNHTDCFTVFKMDMLANNETEIG